MAKVLKIRRRQEEDEAEEVVTKKKRPRDEDEEEEEERPAKKMKTGKKAKIKKESWTTGATSGLGIAAFQNLTLENNRKTKLTDAQLAAKWRKEFPNAKADYTEKTVKGVRSAYNKGKHNNEVPLKPVPEYDEEGLALPFRGEKSAKKKKKQDDGDDARPAKKKRPRDEEEEEEEEEEEARPAKKLKKKAR